MSSAGGPARGRPRWRRGSSTPALLHSPSPVSPPFYCPFRARSHGTYDKSQPGAGSACFAMLLTSSRSRSLLPPCPALSPAPSTASQPRLSTDPFALSPATPDPVAQFRNSYDSDSTTFSPQGRCVSFYVGAPCWRRAEHLELTIRPSSTAPRSGFTRCALTRVRAASAKLPAELSFLLSPGRVCARGRQAGLCRRRSAIQHARRPPRTQGAAPFG